MTVTIRDLQEFKERGERFVMLTCYDYTTARILARAEIPALLVGDSLGNTMLGYSTTLPVTMHDMLHHAKAVARGAPEQLLIGDLPFNSYHASDEEAIRNAASFLQIGMHAVKLEGGGRIVPLVQKFVERGIPVMGHLGLTPQWVNLFGGFKVQGKEHQAAEKIRTAARELEDAGVFALVLEGVPMQLAADITHELSVPTIGIGAGPECDGQVLVLHDLLGLTQGQAPKFAKAYANLGEQIFLAAEEFAREVAERKFPDDAHSYH